MTKCYLPVNIDDLAEARTSASDDVGYFLDLQTGLVLFVTADIRGELEMTYQELGHEPSAGEEALAAALEQSKHPEWLREELTHAYRIEQGSGSRYIAIPGDDSRQSYRDMEEFVETVASPQIRAQLADALEGRKVFRRFKDALLAYPAERERWFAFSAARARERALDWLAAQDIEVVKELG